MDIPKARESGFVAELKRMCTAKSGAFVYITAATLVVYYFIYDVIATAGIGSFFYEVPSPVVALVIITSAVLLGTSLYSLYMRRKKSSLIAAGYGLVSTVAGGLTSSCGCVNSLVGIILYYIGFGAYISSGASSGIEYLRFPIIIFFLGVNIVLIYVNITGRKFWARRR